MSKLRPSIRCSTEIGPWTDPVLVVHLTLDNIVRHHGLEFHLYANNIKLYFAFRLSTAEQQSSLARIEACAGHIDSWLVQNKLKLNTEKTELLILNASYRPRPTIGTIQVSNVPLGTSESSMIKKWLLSNTSLLYVKLVFFILGV